MLNSFRTLPEALGSPSELVVIPLLAQDSDFDFAHIDDAKEPPIYFVYHDECHLYGGARGVEAWLYGKVETSMIRFDEQRRI